MKTKIQISIKFIPIFFFWLILNYHRDSVFPFQLSTSQTILRIYSAAFFVALMSLFILSFKLKDRKIMPSAILFKFLLIGIVFLCFVVLEFSLLRLFRAEDKIFSGKNLEPLIIFHFCLLFVVCSLVFFISKFSVSKLIFLFTLISSLISLSIIWFIPNTAKLGDLMPILESQGNATLNGESIYQYFKLDNGVKTQAVRQPGMHLLYLPAVILNFDLRIMNVIYFALIILILYKILKKQVSNEELLLSLSLLIFFPYRLFRVDYYDVPYILIFLLSIYLLRKLLAEKTESRQLSAESLKAENRETRYSKHDTQNSEHRTPNTEDLKIYNSSFIIHNLSWGLGISIQVWSWLFSPFLWLFLWKKVGFKLAVISTLISTVTALTIMMPFIVTDPHNYYEHVFGFYDGIRSTGIKAETSIHLAPLLNLVVSSKYFTSLQVLIVAIIGLSSIKFMRSFHDLIFFFGLAFFGFMALNPLTWPYMFILIFVMMLIGLVKEKGV